MKTQKSMSYRRIHTAFACIWQVAAQIAGQSFQKPNLKAADKKWSFVETAASTGESIFCIYSILLADVMGRADELQVSEEDLL